MKTIPVIDIRDTGPLALLTEHKESAIALIAASANTYGAVSRIASKVALPAGDYLSRHWIAKTHNPYLPEIRAFAQALAVPGIYTLNMACEWGCTSGVYHTGTGIALTRVLDWPFPELGEHLVVALQHGAAGDFYNVTWPGVSGIFTAMKPRKFSAALNMAPMRRYKTGIITDWVRNRVRLYQETGLPPAHLLRQVFETAPDYASAKQMLCTAPLASPVIYILGGVHAGEGCVIERLEDRYVVRELGTASNVCAANHFESHLNGVGDGWSARPLDSHGRSLHASGVESRFLDEEMRWFGGAAANPLSRLAVFANASEPKLYVTGTFGATPVTHTYRM